MVIPQSRESNSNCSIFFSSVNPSPVFSEKFLFSPGNYLASGLYKFIEDLFFVFIFIFHSYLPVSTVYTILVKSLP